MTRKERVAYNFRRLRRERGWTQEETAERGGVSKGYIGKIESPRLKSSWGPDAEQKWSAIFNVDVSEFYKIPTEEEKGVPIIAYISAGDGIISESCNQYSVGEGFEFLPLPPGYTQEQAERECIYGLKVRGDSMLPMLKDGWKLYIKPWPDKSSLKSGDLVIFRDTEGRGWVKEIELINNDLIIFKSVGQGPTLVKKFSEIQVIEKVYLIMP